MIKHIADRPGHDRRYALNCTKMKELGWQPSRTFEEALQTTVGWYRDNQEWWRNIKEGGDYSEFYERNYRKRIADA